MSVVIRLTKMGKRGERRFRVVVKEKRSRRDGKAMEILGWYERRETQEKSEINRDRLAYWIQNGAKPSEAVTKILKL